MRRPSGRAVAAVLSILLAVLLAPSCFLSRGPQNAADEMASVASRSQDATFAVTYQYTQSRDLAPGVTTTMEISQEPPASVRRLDTSTRSEEDETITVTSWHVRNDEGEFTCAAYEAGVRCQANPLARGTFGSEKLDEFFDAPRDAAAWESVRKAARTVRIEGEPATCFEAIPAPPTPVAASPEPVADRFRFELCYAEDGILMRGGKTSIGSDAQQRAESVVEIVSLSRVVAPADLALPGPVVDPSELR